MVEEVAAKRLEELVARRVEEELEKRREEIEAEVLRRVEEAKCLMEQQMLEELQEKRRQQEEDQKQREVKLSSSYVNGDHFVAIFSCVCSYSAYVKGGREEVIVVAVVEVVVQQGALVHTILVRTCDLTLLPDMVLGFVSDDDCRILSGKGWSIVPFHVDILFLKESNSHDMGKLYFYASKNYWLK